MSKVSGSTFESEVIYLSAAKNLWGSFVAYFNLQEVIRSGFTRTGIYGFWFDPNDPDDNPEEQATARKYLISTTGAHSGRTANLLSDMMELYPTSFSNVDKYLAVKVALCHDIGERVVGDISADGSKAHIEKEEREWQAVLDYYDHLPVDIRQQVAELHREFDKGTSFMGQAIRVADKLDALGELIINEGRGRKGDVLKKREPSEQDKLYAEIIGSGNCTDEWAYAFYQMMQEEAYSTALQMIARDFLAEGLDSIGRKFYYWWPR